MSQKIAERLKELRGKSTQAEIAKIAGVSPATVSNWENWENDTQHSSPTAEAIAALADHWNVSADYIVGRSEFRSGLAPDSFIVDKLAADDLLAGIPRKKVAEKHEGGLAAKVPRVAVVMSFREYQDLQRRIARAQGERRNSDAD